MSGEEGLCDHWGDTTHDGEVIKEGDRIYHKDCLQSEIPRCRKAVQAYKEFYSTDKEENIFCIAINVQFLYGYSKYKQDKQAKRRKRALKLKQLVRKVCALRNSNSGSILIQLVGIDQGDSFTGVFDEFVDQTLNNIIEDGKLFGEAFHRERMSSHEKFREYSDFIVLRVSAASFLTTSDFKTKVALDDSIVDPSPQNIFKFLGEKKRYPEKHPSFKYKFAEDLKELEECRSIQLKANFKEREENITTTDLITKIFNELKLKDYISTFAKNKEGGIYLFGVGEKPKDYECKKYTSRLLDIHGVELSDVTAIKEGIEERIRDEILVCDFSGENAKCDDIVKVECIPFKDNQEKYVVKVTARPVQGIVFSDKEGPQAYKVEPISDALESAETRIQVKEWFNIILKHINDKTSS